jgi:TRAP-type C4-dicarboxylate transport system substrate-binding protein
MNFGTVAPDGTPWSDQLRGVQTRVQSESGGRVKIKLFLGGALGSEIEMIHSVSRGDRLQGGGFSTGAIGQALDIPLLSMPELPYLFKNVKEADAILDGVLFEPVQKDLAQKGMVLAAWAENGWRSFATIGGPARTPAELSKYKMRCQENPIHVNMYEALGATPVAKPTSEVLPALNTGIVNGFDNTPLFSLAAGWMEPVTHYTLSKHIYQPAGVVYSKKFMDSLPADLHKVVMGDPYAEAVSGRKAVRKLQKELVSTVGEMGKTVVKLDASQKNDLRNATKIVHEKFLQAHPDVIDEYKLVKDTLSAIRAQ